MRVVYFQQVGTEEPWFGDFLSALTGRHEVVILDPSAPLEPQFAGTRVVVDQGGHASPAMIAAGAAGGVELWQVLGTGVDHTEIGCLLDHGIRVANTPGAFSAPALAEHALLLMLAVAKRLPVATHGLAQRVLYVPLGSELAGRTLGLVGLGASGRELALRASALGMRVIALDATPADERVLAGLGVEAFGGPEFMPALLRQADYVSLHVPLTTETRHLIDTEALALMRPSAILINVSRGGLVDQDALTRALADGRLAGAGLDVFTTEPPDPGDPLLALDNVVATPHIAGVTRETSLRRGAACAENVERIAAGLPPLYEITRRDEPVPTPGRRGEE